MIDLLGVSLQMTKPSPFTGQRDVEAFVRGPAGSPADCFGTENRYRYGLWHDKLIAKIPEPEDSFPNELFGFIESGNVTVDLVDDVDAGLYTYILLEDGSYLLLEDGTNLVLE